MKVIVKYSTLFNFGHTKYREGCIFSKVQFRDLVSMKYFVNCKDKRVLLIPIIPMKKCVDNFVKILN